MKMEKKSISRTILKFAFAKTASLFFPAVFAAFEKKAYGQNGFAF